jgi:hypothetical protein
MRGNVSIREITESAVAKQPIAGVRDEMLPAGDPGGTSRE